MNTDVFAAALNWSAAGCSVVPALLDGSKRPDGVWLEYQEHPPTTDQIVHWFSNDVGIGLICGQVSGNLEMTELEGRAVDEGLYDRVTDLFEAAGLVELWNKLTLTGYAESTPSGGIHILYRVDGLAVPGNTKLANRPARDDELRDDEREVLRKKPDKVFSRCLAETRGEGGFVVVAPTPGIGHESGQPWVTLIGSPATLPTITAEEREQLHRILRSLDQMPAPAPVRAPQPKLSFGDGATPGDDFGAKTDWEDILVPHGWRPISRVGDERYWCRPGKASGISATTNHQGTDTLKVFSSSTEFDTEGTYSKFAAYAVLEHGGDMTAAARHLGGLGYGDQRDGATIALTSFKPNISAPTPSSTPDEPVPEPDSEPEPGEQPPSAIEDAGYQQLVDLEYARQKAREEARKRLTEESAGTAEHLARLRASALGSAALRKMPEPTHLAEGLLVVNSLAWLHSKPKSFKSFWAIDLVGHVATGRKWHGRDVHRSNVLYVVAEGAGGIGKRVAAWEDYHHCSLEGLVTFIPFAVQFAKPDEVAALAAFAKEMEAGLVVIDTQARSTVGMDESSAKDMSVYVDRAEEIKKATEACVLTIHHEGWAGGHMRGSSAMQGGADSVLSIDRSGMWLTLVSEAQKDIPEAEDIKYLMQPLSGSLVVTGGLEGMADLPELTEGQTELMERLINTTEIGGLTASELRAQTGQDRRRLHDRLNWLKSKGLLRKEGQKFLATEEGIEMFNDLMSDGDGGEF